MSPGRVACLCIGCAGGVPAVTGHAQDYPVRPIRVITSEVGGGNDFAARLIGASLSRDLGQQVIVENRGGASGMIAGDIVAKAPPDGYTLLLYSGTIWIVPLLQKVALDPLRDFTPITLAVSSPNILVVHPSLPVRSVRDLIALAKKRPGELNYASVGTGSGSHLSAELFKSMAGVQMLRIQYKGSAPALNDLLGGRVELHFGTSGSTASHVSGGRLRALAVTSPQPSPVFPGVPTVAASGLAGYEYRNTYSLFAPAGASAALVGFLHKHVLKVLNTPEVKERFLRSGVEVVGSSPAELASIMKTETVTMGKLIRDAGIRGD